VVFVLVGLIPILVGLGVFPPPSPPQAPPWVIVCTGLTFVLAGLAVVVDYGIAAAMGDALGPDGDFPAGTPFAIRLANYVLGLGIVGSMVSIFGWVAFGRGERHFSTTIAVPFVAWHSASGEMSGRIAFGAATVLLGVMFVVCGVVGVQRLMRARR
jgi:hypothetical protein